MQTGRREDGINQSLPTEEVHEDAANSLPSWFKILRVEYGKFFSMTLLYFSIVLAYSILRDTKDAVVIERMLPASIQYLKSFIVMGATMTFAIFFQFLLSKGITLEKIMFSLNVGFGVFFFTYATLLLPNVTYLEPYQFWINDVFADKKMFFCGLEFLKGLLLTLNFWTGTILYVSAELWGNMMTSVMFFAIANEICPLRQALRFYPFFILAANLGLMASGGIMVFNSYLLDWYPSSRMLIVGLLIVFVAGLCVSNIMIYRHLVKNIIPYPIYIVSDAAPRRSKKAKVGMIDGFKTMAATPIVFHLSMTVLAYGICTNLTESAYKSAMHISSKSTTKSTMTTVMRTQGLQQISIGAAVIAVLLSPMKMLIQKRGWLSLGLLTPICTMAGAIAFLLYVWGNVSVDLAGKAADNILIRIGKPIFTAIGWTSSTNRELWIGFFVVNLIKILKYAAFDICKEAIGVKIPKQYKARFKGVYDGIFGKLGKSLSSNMQIAMFAVLNTSDIRTASLCLALLVLLVSLAWTNSSLYLGKTYDAAVREKRDIYVSPLPAKGQGKPMEVSEREAVAV